MTLSYTSVAAEVFIASTQAQWVPYDLYTYKSVPKGAVAEIIIRNANIDNERIGGVREKDSSLERKIAIHEAEGGGYTTVEMLIQTDPIDGTIEVYAETKVDIDFVLMGYFEGCGFTESFISLGSPTTGWADKDLSGNGLPANAVSQILMGNMADGDIYFAGVRAKGSGLERGIILDEAEAGGYNLSSIIVKADESSIIEWKGGSTDIDMWLLGWFSNVVDFTEGWTHVVMGTKEDDLWVSKTLTDPPANSIISMSLVHQDSRSETRCGVREEGSSQARRFSEHETEGGGGAGFMACVNLNGSKQLEITCQDSSESLFYYTGYFIELEIGFLNVDTMPVKGEVFVEEESWGTAPQERELLVGFYTVSFGDIPGYVTPDPIEAEVTADQTTYIEETYTEAWYCTLNGTIEATEENCVERGFDWGEAPDTYTKEWTEEGSYPVGSFSHQLTNLDVEKTYYFRAKARNPGGWGYGEEKSVYYPEVPVGWKQLEYFTEPPTGGQWNRLRYEAEPPVANAWNKLKFKA